MEDDVGARCPRTSDEVAALLNTRPDMWEYLLYGGTLLIERAKLEDQYRDHVLGYAEPDGPPLDVETAIDEASAAFGDALAMAATLMNMFDAERHEQAFGKPGEAGDAILIQHLAKRTVDGYSEMMAWSRRLLSMRVPTEMQQLFRFAAALMETPVGEFRDYVDDVVAQLDKAAVMSARRDAQPDARDEGPVEVTVQLTLTIEENALQRFNDELHRVETAMLSP